MAIAVSEGPTWQTIAIGAAGIVFSIAIGAGGYFLAQQATHDARQDTFIDSMSQKMIDISIAMVKISTASSDASAKADKALSLLEQRDQRELADFRHRAELDATKPPPGKAK